MKTTKKEAPKELGAVQKAPPFLWANCLRHRRIEEIVGGHVNHPDIPYRGQFAAGAVAETGRKAVQYLCRDTDTVFQGNI